MSALTPHIALREHAGRIKQIKTVPDGGPMTYKTVEGTIMEVCFLGCTTAGQQVHAVPRHNTRHCHHYMPHSPRPQTRSPLFYTPMCPHTLTTGPLYRTCGPLSPPTATPPPSGTARHPPVAEHQSQ